MNNQNVQLSIDILTRVVRRGGVFDLTQWCSHDAPYTLTEATALEQNVDACVTAWLQFSPELRQPLGTGTGWEWYVCDPAKPCIPQFNCLQGVIGFAEYLNIPIKHAEKILVTDCDPLTSSFYGKSIVDITGADIIQKLQEL